MRLFGIQERRTGSQAASRSPTTQVTTVSRPRHLPMGRWHPLSYQADKEEIIWDRYEVTGIFFKFEGLFPLNPPDSPEVKGFHGFHTENRTGNNRKLSEILISDLRTSGSD